MDRQEDARQRDGGMNRLGHVHRVIFYPFRWPSLQDCALALGISVERLNPAAGVEVLSEAGEFFVVELPE